MRRRVSVVGVEDDVVALGAFHQLGQRLDRPANADRAVHHGDPFLTSSGRIGRAEDHCAPLRRRTDGIQGARPML